MPSHWHGFMKVRCGILMKVHDVSAKNVAIRLRNL